MSKTEYSKAQIYLHWTMMVLIVLQFLTGDSLVHFMDDVLGGGSTWGEQGFGANYHMFMGIIVLILGSARLTLRKVQGVPPHVKSGPEWTHTLADIVQKLLYVFIFVTPLSGMLGVMLQTPTALTIHLVIRAILIVLILTHFAGALYQLYTKSGSFQRMWKFK